MYTQRRWLPMWDSRATCVSQIQMRCMFVKLGMGDSAVRIKTMRQTSLGWGEWESLTADSGLPALSVHSRQLSRPGNFGNCLARDSASRLRSIWLKLGGSSSCETSFCPVLCPVSCSARSSKSSLSRSSPCLHLFTHWTVIHMHMRPEQATIDCKLCYHAEQSALES